MLRLFVPLLLAHTHTNLMGRWQSQPYAIYRSGLIERGLINSNRYDVNMTNRPTPTIR